MNKAFSLPLSMNDKIEDNPSHKKFKKQLDNADQLAGFVKLLGENGLDTESLIKALEDGVPGIKKQFDALSKTPDQFNGYFSQKGWIAYESMNFDLMKDAVKLADERKIDAAEELLIKHYTSTEIKRLIITLRGTPEFNIRIQLIEHAYDDTCAGRYYASIPLLLTIIDGVVNDVDKRTGFFAEKTDVVAWDSIAAHSTGLATLKSIFTAGRNKTNSDEITLPYRNGILHGRDLNFANKFVAAKCWLTVFAIRDWADAVKKGKRNEPEPEKELSIYEHIESINESLAKHERTKEMNKLIDDWKTRKIVIGTDVPKSGASNAYNEFSPEKRAVEFVECWSKKNYGAIAQQIWKPFKKAGSVKEEAGKIRTVFEGRKITGFQIIAINDQAPAVTEVILQVEFMYNNTSYTKEIKLRLIYQDSEGNNMIHGEKGGDWKFIPNFFHEIEFVN